MKSNCSWCGIKVENNLDKLADHIFKAHSDNAELCSWARTELEKAGKPANNEKPKYMGKSVDRIPPTRKEKIPKYLKKQLPK